jgi:competence protein ComEC
MDRLEVWLATERHQLVLFAPVMLGLGIVAWFVLPFERQWLAATLAGVAVALAGVAATGLVRRVVVAGGVLFAFGVGLAWLRAEAVRTPVLADARLTASIEGTVLAVERLPARQRTRIVVRISSGAPRDLVARIGAAALPDGVAPGAAVAMRARLSPPPGPNIPGGYHFARRAWFDGIGAVGYALSGVTVTRPPPAGPDIVARFNAFRARLTQALQEGVGGRAGGLAAALVTGDRGGIPDEVTETMRDSGLAHLISISGLHIAVVVGGTLWATRRILVLSQWIALRADIKALAASVAALAGISYTMLAGGEVPTIRACIAVLIALAGLAAGRDAISLRMIAAGAFAILVVRPEYLLGPSFQLSFAAVTAIVALYQSPLGARLARRSDEFGWLRRLGVAVVALLATGAVAEIALAPIAFFHFNQMGLYGMVANFVAIPLTSFVILPLLVLAIAADAIGIGAPVFAVLERAVEALIRIGEVTASLPGAVARLPSAPGWSLALIVLGGIWLCLWQSRRRWAGVAPALAGAAAMVAAAPPDVIVDGSGAHMAIVDGSGIALLRPRAGDYLRSMWSDAAGVASVGALDDRRDARCGPDACVVRVHAGSRDWLLLATRSRLFIDRAALEPSCARADLVVSDRTLPGWCRPRWLKLDRRRLARSGAIALWLDGPRYASVAAIDGDHPWRRP